MEYYRLIGFNKKSPTIEVWKKTEDLELLKKQKKDLDKLYKNLYKYEIVKIIN